MSAVLFSKRLGMRPVISSNVDALYRIYGDPRTHQYNPAGVFPNVGYAQKILDLWLDEWKTLGFSCWAIFEKQNPDKIIGFGGICAREFSHTLLNNLGYRFACEAWGKGYATEFTKSAVAFGFDSIGFRDISAIVRESHLVSQKVLHKSGLKPVKTVQKRDEMPPWIVYRICMNEWKNHKRLLDV